MPTVRGQEEDDQGQGSERAGTKPARALPWGVLPAVGLSAHTAHPALREWETGKGSTVTTRRA